jgi:hypothetical protein
MAAVRRIKLGCLLLLLVSCGRQAAPPLRPAPAPLTLELTARLRQELKTLGKDPQRTVAAAPQGADNSVFDLTAVQLDAAGQPLPPGQPGPGGVRLNWTERLLGDYDQNGEVNAADIQPLAQHFKAAVQYVNPAVHGGFAGWPADDPEAAGARNWRLARIDGDANGEANAADIQRIAQHFKETLGGYRVYRRAPGASTFTRLPDPLQPGSELSVPKPLPPAPSQLVPVRYSFSDPQAAVGGLGAGTYEYFVVPYAPSTAAEGPACATLSIDIVAGTVNRAPVAALQVSPELAGAPAPVLLDATAAFDFDGLVQGYRWDVDGDGIVDYSAPGPVPAGKSSSGAASAFVVPAPGQLQVAFDTASGQWYRPQVTVVDDAGQPSQPVSGRLGITGWQSTAITRAGGSANMIDFTVNDMRSDPASGRILVAGNGTGDQPAAASPGICVAWLEAGTLGAQHQVVAFDDPQFGADSQAISSVSRLCLGFSPALEPCLIFTVNVQVGFSVKLHTYILHPAPDGPWQVERLRIPYAGEQYSVDIVNSADYLAPGRFALNAWCKSDTQTEETVCYAYLENGAWRIEPAPPETLGTDATTFALDPGGTLHCVPGGGYDTQSGLFLADHSDPAGWAVQELAAGQFDLPDRKTRLKGYAFNASGGLVLGIDRLKILPPGAPAYSNDALALVREVPGGFALTELGAADGLGLDLYLYHNSAYIFSSGDRWAKQVETYYQQEVTPSGAVIADTVCAVPRLGSTSPFMYERKCIASDGTLYTIYFVNADGAAGGQFLARRLDPRLLNPGG